MSGEEQFDGEECETSMRIANSCNRIGGIKSISHTVPRVLVIPKKIEVCRNTRVRKIQEKDISVANARQERNYWNRIVSQRISSLGTIHIRVGEGLLLLGTAHMRCKEYHEALKVFRSATLIFRSIYGDMHLGLARALNKLGLAASHLYPTLTDSIAFEALHESFTIRLEKLGPNHTDTIDSLNNIAGHKLRMKNYNAACKAYHEVFLRRQLIFGKRHPSVAITAQSLGEVYMKLAQLNCAKKYYTRAMNLYQRLELRDKNQSIQRLLHDIRALECADSERKVNY